MLENILEKDYLIRPGKVLITPDIGEAGTVEGLDLVYTLLDNIAINSHVIGRTEIPAFEAQKDFVHTEGDFVLQPAHIHFV